MRIGYNAQVLATCGFAWEILAKKFMQLQFVVFIFRIGFFFFLEKNDKFSA